MTKTALVLAFSDLRKDPRVWRHLDYLKERGYAITALGEEDPQIQGIEFLSSQTCENPNWINCWKWRIKRIFKTLFKRFDSIYWSHPKIKKVLSLVGDRSFDLILANDLDTLPLADQFKKNGLLIFDAHEYAPKEFEDLFLWRFFIQPYRNFLCLNYLKKADLRLTVCQGIAEEYSKVFQLPFHVITNASPRHAMVPKPVTDGKIRMIYHGCATPSRSIEDVLMIMKLLDYRFELDIILVPGDLNYIEKIRELGKELPNVRFLNPVPMLEIIRFCNQYDIGFFPLKPKNINYLFALPNKFFEFIQARVVPAVYPLPEMKRLIDQYQMGVVAKNFSIESFAEALNALDGNKIWEMKQNMNQAAYRLSAEENYQLLDGMF